MYNTNRFVLQELRILTWRVSDCEELVGILLGGCLTVKNLVGVDQGAKYETLS